MSRVATPCIGVTPASLTTLTRARAGSERDRAEPVIEPRLGPDTGGVDRDRAQRRLMLPGVVVAIRGHRQRPEPAGVDRADSLESLATDHREPSDQRDIALPA